MASKDATPKKNARKAAAPKKTPVFFGLAHRYRRPDGKMTVTPRWGVLAGLGIGGFILAYVLGATALYAYFKYYRSYEEVDYFSMYTLPFDRAGHRQKMGNYNIGKAIELAEEGKHSKAIFLLQTGVRQAPGNLEGRKRLAEYFYYGFRRPEKAITTMSRGLPYAQGEADYLRTYFEMLLREQEDQEVIEVAREILANDNNPEELEKLVAYFAAAAHRFRGNFDEAVEFLDNHNLDATVDGVLLEASIDWERGQRDKAIEVLEDALVQFPNADLILQQLAFFHRAQGNYDIARRYTIQRSGNNPLAIDPKISLLFIYDETGETERSQRTISFLKSRYSSSPNNLYKLSNYAAEQGNLTLARDLYAIALEKDFPIANFAISLIRAHLTAGDYAGAESFAEELAEESPKWLEDSQSALDSLRAIALRGTGRENLSQVYLDRFLKEGRVRVEYLLYIANEFEKMGAYPAARQVLEHAYRNNPKNQPALTRLIELDLETGNSEKLGARLKDLLAMRRPSTEILEHAYRALGSDRFIFTRDREEILIKLDSILKYRATADMQPEQQESAS